MRATLIVGLVVSLVLAGGCKKEETNPTSPHNPNNPASPILAPTSGWETLGSAKRRSMGGIDGFYGAKGLALGVDSTGQVGVAYEEFYNLQQSTQHVRINGLYKPGDTLALKPFFPFTQESQVDFTYEYRYVPGTTRLYQSYFLIRNATSFPSYRVGLIAEPISGVEDIYYNYDNPFADFHTLPVLTTKDEVMMAGTKAGNSHQINGAYTDSFYNSWPRQGRPEIGRLLRYSGYDQGTTQAHNAVRLPSGKIVSLLGDNGKRIVLGQLPLYGGSSRELTEIAVLDTAGIGVGYVNYAKRVGDAAIFTYLAVRSGSRTITCFRHREGETSLNKVFGPVPFSGADAPDTWLQDDQGQLFGYKSASAGDRFMKLGAAGLQTIGTIIPSGYNAPAFSLSNGYLYTLVAPVIGGQVGMKNQIDLVRVPY